MVKLYFKEECTKFLNLNEETGEPDDDTDRPTKTYKVSGYEDLPKEEVVEEPKSVDEEIF